jgi:hypothetical protein
MRQESHRRGAERDLCPRGKRAEIRPVKRRSGKLASRAMESPGVRPWPVGPTISGLHPLLQSSPMVGAGHSRHKYFDRFRFSALASQAPFIPRRPIYAGVVRTSVSQGQRMPTSSRKSRIFFPTENEPIFRPGLRPERGSHFVKIQAAANSRHAIQKTGVNRWIGSR